MPPKRPELELAKMKMNHTVCSSAFVAGLLVSNSALAQDVSVGADASAAATTETAQAETAAETESDAAAVEEAAAVDEEAAAEVEEAEAEAEEAAAEDEEAAAEDEEAAAEVEEAVAEEVVEEEEEEGGASIMVFADGYAAFQTAKSGVGAGGGVYSSSSPSGTAQSGFGLNFLGLDLGYDGGEWGLTGSIRAGTGVYQYGVGILGGSVDGVTGIGITNAFATWRPVEGLAIDLGVFGTIYGAEVAESWMNLNYTRGELYFNYQPFWHTGLRAEYATGDFVFRALVVNDANTATLEQGAINGGLQAGYDNGTFGLIVGGLQSFAPDTSAANTDFLDTFFDVVLTVNAGDLSVVGNFDLNVGYATSEFWGASLAAGYAFTDSFGVALRGEYLSNNDGLLDGGSDSLITGTLTIDTKPAGSENFVVRWDNRVEAAAEDAFSNLAGDPNDTAVWFSSTIGVAAFADLL